MICPTVYYEPHAYVFRATSDDVQRCVERMRALEAECRRLNDALKVGRKAFDVATAERDSERNQNNGLFVRAQNLASGFTDIAKALGSPCPSAETAVWIVERARKLVAENERLKRECDALDGDCQTAQASLAIAEEELDNRDRARKAEERVKVLESEGAGQLRAELNKEIEFNAHILKRLGDELSAFLPPDTDVCLGTLLDAITELRSQRDQLERDAEWAKAEAQSLSDERDEFAKRYQRDAQTIGGLKFELGKVREEVDRLECRASWHQHDSHTIDALNRQVATLRAELLSRYAAGALKGFGQ